MAIVGPGWVGLGRFSTAVLAAAREVGSSSPSPKTVLEAPIGPCTRPSPEPGRDAHPAFGPTGPRGLLGAGQKRALGPRKNAKRLKRGPPPFLGEAAPPAQSRSSTVPRFEMFKPVRVENTQKPPFQQKPPKSGFVPSMNTRTLDLFPFPY